MNTRNYYYDLLTSIQTLLDLEDRILFLAVKRRYLQIEFINLLGILLSFTLGGVQQDNIGLT